MSEDKTEQKVSTRLTRRDFLKVAIPFGAGGLATIYGYLRTDLGKKFTGNLLRGIYEGLSNIEIEDEARELLNVYNETLERSLGKGNDGAAALELKKHRDVVFAAAQNRYINLKVKWDESRENQARLNIFHNPNWDRNTLEILVSSPQRERIESVKGISHEFEHAYQYVVALAEVGNDPVKIDYFINHSHTDPDTELDAHIMGNVGAYLYARTHPEDKQRGLTTDPNLTGVDEIEFTDYWVGRRKVFPEHPQEDIEYRWFLERYSALLDVQLDILTGKDQHLLYPLTVRDTDVPEDYLKEVSRFFPGNDWSKAMEFDWDPTEKNLFVLRHFLEE